MRVLPRNGGHLEVVCGSMFCGKSEELMRRILRASIAKQKTIIFKPKIDNRYHETKVVSHVGRKADAVAVSSPEDILTKVGDAEVVGVDEVQFFDDRIIEVVQDLVRMGKRVIVAGLDMDFRGEPFGPMPELLARAEFVDKLQAICVVCGEPATRTQRLLDGKPAPIDAPLVQIGAAEAYEARCRGCHKLGAAKHSN